MHLYKVIAAFLCFELAVGPIQASMIGGPSSEQLGVGVTEIVATTTGRPGSSIASLRGPGLGGGLYEPGCRNCPDYLATAPCLSGCDSGPNNCGGPVTSPSGAYLFSGEFFESAEDLRIKGRGPDFVWSRKYRSRLGPIAGIGAGWDYSYDIRVVLVDDKPSEVLDLQFPDNENMNWDPPADLGGPLASLRYCTLRSTDPSDFNNGATTAFVETNGTDQTTEDTGIPAPGQLFSYVISASNVSGEGGIGTDSNNVARAGLACSPSAGPDLLLWDGDTRRDVYDRQVDGTWTAPEFFRVFEQNPDTSFTLNFPDTGTWNFFPLDGSPAEGRIRSIVDRNGNTLTFQYDAFGRLDTIIDTLNRNISIGYNVNGFIQSVTDFAGRQVNYEYYNLGDPGGTFGDLKSVTTPTVIGTPHGNDFPLGKTTTYTYSTGFADEQLNHNLLTITDPKGQTYLVNEYSPDLNPLSLEFDRLVRQTWGDPGQVIDYSYRQVAPTVANNFGVIETIHNDRVGNVTEFFFDDGNRNVLLREYTGRANPNLPTTDVANRPVGQLRPGDPPLFETRFEYNPDSLVTLIVHPNLNEEQLTFDIANASRRSQSNLTDRCLLPGPLGGDQPQICELFEYDDDFGGCCGTNFVTRHVDGRGNETLHGYDPNGNRIHTDHRIPSIVEDFEYNLFGQLTAHVLPDNGSGSRRRDEFTYYAAGPQLGYREDSIVDALGFALTTTREYDPVGNVVREIDPKGNDTQFVVNQLDQTVREISREVAPGGPRYEVDTFYDANDNVVRVDVQNIDEQGLLQPNSQFTTLYEYDILNFMTRTCDESGAFVGAIPGSTNLPTCTGTPDTEFVSEAFEYDANRNRTLVRYGEAVEGRQPTNTLTTFYDERDLVFQVIRAQGDPDQSTDQLDYDSNQNVIRESKGLESAPKVTTSTYDGYDRMVSRTDPMGNVETIEYDANSNPVGRRVEGELNDVPGGAGNVRLDERAAIYDAMDRRIIEEVEFFDTQTQTPLPGGQQPGKAITTTDYSDNSQITAIINDNNHAIVTIYDSANRPEVMADPKGNEQIFVYDPNSNVVDTVHVDKSDQGNPDQLFSTVRDYDGLDRLTATVDNIGNTDQYGYDSRDNRTVTVDALGNVTFQLFDGLSRPLATVRELTDTGDGGGTVIGAVTTQQAWDDTSRVILRVDDNGNPTVYVFDALNRRIEEQFADFSVHSDTYDVHDNFVVHTDPNGTTVTFTHDELDRYIAKAVVHGPGVQGTTADAFAYDGRSRLILAQDDDSTVTAAYDSLSHVTEETLNGVSTVTSYDGASNPVQYSYPGGRVISCTYDELERKKTVSDGGGLLASYEFIGPHRVELRAHGNNTQAGYEYDGVSGIPNAPGDFGVRRIVNVTHENPGGGGNVDVRNFVWGPKQNKRQSSNPGPGGPQLSHDYVYDSIYRVTRTIVTDFTPVVVRQTQYELDGVGNRLNVFGNPDPGPYLMDPTFPNPADALMNQYSNTPFDTRQYDANGNLVAIDVGLPSQRNLTYDYRNQLLAVEQPAFGDLNIYSYDALGRRFERTVDVNGFGGGPFATKYYYSGWQVFEEQDGVGTTLATNVHGLDMDDVISRQVGPNQYFFHTDDLESVTAVTDQFGNVVERYIYDDYGLPQFFDGAYAAIPQSAIENPYLFTGRRFDPETGFYYYRTRYLDPRAGRFLSRDLFGLWGDEANAGNPYAYVGNRFATFNDPLGLDGSATITLVAAGVTVVGGGIIAYYTTGCEVGEERDAVAYLDCEKDWKYVRYTSWCGEYYWEKEPVMGTKRCTLKMYCARNWVGRAGWYESPGSRNCDPCK